MALKWVSVSVYRCGTHIQMCMGSEGQIAADKSRLVSVLELGWVDEIESLKTDKETQKQYCDAALPQSAVIAPLASALFKWATVTSSGSLKGVLLHYMRSRSHKAIAETCMCFADHIYRVAVTLRVKVQREKHPAPRKRSKYQDITSLWGLFLFIV